MAIATKALVLHGPKDLRLETVSLPPPSPHDLQIALRSITLCGSDLHYYTSFRNGSITVQEPLILGHESSGIVTGIGSAVTDFSIGDRVALEVGIPCGECEFCTGGSGRTREKENEKEKETRYNLCENMRFRSSARGYPHSQGVLQERINHPAKWCYKLPDRVTLDEGALVEPLSVAIHATRRAALTPNSRAEILIFGAGAVGLLCAYVAKKAAGPGSSVTITDVDPGRLEFARESGFADHIDLARPCSNEAMEEKLQAAQNTAASLKGIAAPSGFDVVYECTGAESCLQTAIHACKPGGNIMMIGMGTPVQALPISAAATREVNLCGVFRYAHTYQSTIEMFGDATKQDVDLVGLITHRYQGLEKGTEAFEMASRKQDENGKLVMKVAIELGSGEDILE